MPCASPRCGTIEPHGKVHERQSRSLVRLFFELTSHRVRCLFKIHRRTSGRAVGSVSLSCFDARSRRLAWWMKALSCIPLLSGEARLA